jgi:hypothetical protein
MFNDKSNEERMNILRMIEEHRITAEQGALLLAGVKTPVGAPAHAPVAEPTPTSAPAYVPDPEPAAGVMATGKTRMRFFKVFVTDMKSGRKKVSVTLPLSLVKWGLKFSQSHVPEVNGIPIEGLDEIIEAGLEGKLVDVEDEEDGEHVEIYIE